MSNIIFFTKNFEMCENSFWINSLQEYTNRGIIVSTDGFISSVFRELGLIFMSQREGFSIAKNCICIGTEINSLEILDSLFSIQKIFYANVLDFLYSRNRSEFHSFIEKINMYKDKVDIYFPSDNYSKLLQINSSNIISPWDFNKWEKLFLEKEILING